jgi:Protein of unknown function (DUF3455)
VNNKILLIAALIGIVIDASAQGASRPEVPDKIDAPAADQVVLVAYASGSQVYICKKSIIGDFAWTLKAPDAELRNDHGMIIGRHFAGPAWKLTDGSEVTGKAVARVDSPSADSIPWLLVTVVGHSGNGMLNRVTAIQRIHTKGGQPPPASQCSASKENVEARSKYTAEYYFYEPSKP